jgi:ribosomal protein L25 (general stress protein Ctc)
MVVGVARLCESAWFNVGDEVTRLSRSREWPDIFVVDKGSPKACLRADWKNEVISLDIKLLDSAPEMKDFLIAKNGKEISLYLYGEEDKPLLSTTLKMSDFEQATETRNKQENMTLSTHTRLVCTKDLYRRLLKERLWRLVTY